MASDNAAPNANRSTWYTLKNRLAWYTRNKTNFLELQIPHVTDAHISIKVKV